jgi:hypothetical protein
LRTYLDGRSPGSSYASFDYCFNYFQGVRERGDRRLASAGYLSRSCLHLGFYLASWGMMRGSSELLQRSLRQPVSVVECCIAEQPEESWLLDPRAIAFRVHFLYVFQLV